MHYLSNFNFTPDTVIRIEVNSECIPQKKKITRFPKRYLIREVKGTFANVIDVLFFLKYIHHQQIRVRIEVTQHPFYPYAAIWFEIDLVTDAFIGNCWGQMSLKQLFANWV